MLNKEEWSVLHLFIKTWVIYKEECLWLFPCFLSSFFLFVLLTGVLGPMSFFLSFLVSALARYCVHLLDLCISQSSPEKQNQQDVYMERERRERDYKELAHSVMDTEKFHNLQSTSWRPRKAGGVVPIRGWRPENQGSWYISPRLSPKAWEPGEDQGPSSPVTQRVNSPFIHLLVYSGPQWIGWCHPHWRGHLFSPLI